MPRHVRFRGGIRGSLRRLHGDRGLGSRPARRRPRRPRGEEPALAEQAAASGLAEGRVHVRGTLEDADRAAVLGGAVALLAPSRLAGFPWRVVEALAVGVPVIAADSPTHREIVWDGGVLVPADEEGAFADALAGLLSSTAVVERQAVLAADRGRAFSWLSAAERVWQLHADL
ncbi:glycosyltransferase [Microbacterium hominis]|uniref:glycosyltransferase n=1 Tax=Microbacterium hominis TaxID=162426 RepID=UPI00295EFADA|nr:glycosyltransferase [Microbacterium hominis]